LYFNPSDLEVDNVTNDRHIHTTPSGWKVFKTGTAADSVKEKLADFRAFAVVWFGTDAIRQSVLYSRAGVSIFLSNPRRMWLALSSALKPTGLLQKKSIGWD
jgi:hypothetical protein